MRYSSNTDTQDPSHQPGDWSEILSQRVYHASASEDLRILPKFSGEDSEWIKSWLEQIELVYSKAFINVDEKWLEFIRRQRKDDEIVGIIFDDMRAMDFTDILI